MIPLKTILVPTDFSECSQYALELACVPARAQDARVILLHVVPRPASVTEDDLPAYKADHAEEDLKAYREEMAERLTKVSGKAPYGRVEALLEEGPVADVITHTAEATPCDLIVMGTHGGSGTYQSLMGSVAADVTQSASCPVVTVEVPPRGPEKAGINPQQRW